MRSFVHQFYDLSLISLSDENFPLAKKNKKGASLSLSLACLENAMDGEKSIGQHTVIFFFPLVFFFLFRLIELHLHKKRKELAEKQEILLNIYLARRVVLVSRVYYVCELGQVSNTDLD